jgi:hypothetical protein
MLALLAIQCLRAGELELSPETLKSWDEHVQKATSALHTRCHRSGDKTFLWMDGDADRLSRVRNGEVVVWPANETSPLRIQSGLIHDWFGAAFFPGVHAEDVLAVVRNYSRYKETYRPGVLDAKLLSQSGPNDRFTLLLRNGSFFTKTALDSDYESSYIQIDEHRWYSVSCSSRVQEIENYGQPNEHKLQPDVGHGYIWRMCSLSQLEDRDGGVYVDEEMMALSRDVPAGLRWMAGPIIRRVAKETLAASITRTRTAVKERSGAADYAEVTAPGKSRASAVR